MSARTSARTGDTSSRRATIQPGEVVRAHGEENGRGLRLVLDPHLLGLRRGWQVPAAARRRSRHPQRPRGKAHHETPAVPLACVRHGVRDAKQEPKHQGRRRPGSLRHGSTKTALTETNVAAFQAAWFQIRAAQMGYARMLKWDCHFGRYDKGKQAYYAIGPPGPPAAPKEWQLFPTYHILRLFAITTAPGWKVLSLLRNPSALGSGTKHLVAFQGPGDLTILGLDERGAHRNTPSTTPVPYQIGGLTGTGVVPARPLEQGRRGHAPPRASGQGGRCWRGPDRAPSQRVRANDQAAPTTLDRGHEDLRLCDLP